MKTIRIGVCAVLFCSVLTDAQNSTDKLIDKVKQLSVSSLDATLPDQTLEKFLQAEVGANAEFYWEVNDCAPPPGTKKQKDSPECVETQAQLPDGRGLVVRIKVGNSKKADLDKPEFYSTDLITTRETLQLKKLSDLPPALVKTHPQQNAQQ